MSIFIDRNKCVGCGKCADVCPGNLLKITDHKAVIRHPEDCWGCTSCLKECKVEAVKFFLGADIGGRGSTLTYTYGDDNRTVTWKVISPDKVERVIVIDTQESNKY